MVKRWAMWLTKVTTVLVLGGRGLGRALAVLKSAGVFVGTNTPAAQAADSDETAEFDAAPATAACPADITDMAEGPSSDAASVRGQWGSVRSSGIPSVGYDGDRAGNSDSDPDDGFGRTLADGSDSDLDDGFGNDASTMATDWGDSPSLRNALHEPDFTGATARVCLFFAMTHRGCPTGPALSPVPLPASEPAVALRSIRRNGGDLLVRLEISPS